MKIRGVGLKVVTKTRVRIKSQIWRLENIHDTNDSGLDLIQLQNNVCMLSDVFILKNILYKHFSLSILKLKV